MLCIQVYCSLMRRPSRVGFGAGAQRGYKGHIKSLKHPIVRSYDSSIAIFVVGLICLHVLLITNVE